MRVKKRIQTVMDIAVILISAAYVICILFLGCYISVRNTAILVCALFVLCLFGFLMNKNEDSFRCFLNLSMLLYIIMLLQTVLLKGEPVRDIIQFRIPIKEYLKYDTSFIPFLSTARLLSGGVSVKLCIANIVGNLILLMPLAVYLKLRNCSFMLSFAATAAVSAAIECIQLLLTCGRTDIDDVILNVVGGLAAYLLLCKIKKEKQNV